MEYGAYTHDVMAAAYWCGQTNPVGLQKNTLYVRNKKSTVYSQSRLKGLGKGVLDRIPGFPSQSWVIEAELVSVF